MTSKVNVASPAPNKKLAAARNLSSPAPSLGADSDVEAVAVDVKKLQIVEPPTPTMTPQPALAVAALGNVETEQDVTKVVEQVVAHIKNDGTLLVKDDIVASITQALVQPTPKKDSKGYKKQAGLQLVDKLWAIPSLRPALFTLLPVLMETLADKATPVRTLAETVVGEVFAQVPEEMTRDLVIQVLKVIADNSTKWNTKEFALKSLSGVLVSNERRKEHLRRLLPAIVPVVADAFHDSKEQVQAAARDALTAILALLTNPDLVNILPQIHATIADPTKVTQAIHALGSTTFVSEVDSNTLTVLVPILYRGLKEGVTVIKRKAAVIIGTLSKLVDNDVTVLPFVPVLVPGLEHVKDEISDPEARATVNKCYDTLIKVAGAARESGKEALPAVTASYTDEELATVNKIGGFIKNIVGDEAWTQPYVTFFSHQAFGLLQHDAMEHDPDSETKAAEDQEWKDSLTPLIALMPNKDKFVAELHKACEPLRSAVIHGIDPAHEETGEVVCDCEFSLAYGARILLNRTRLVLRKGARYGIVGANGSGKTTLLRAIENEQVEGFPPKSELRTWMVTHEIDPRFQDVSVVEFVTKDPEFTHLNAEEVEAKLREVGFDDEMLSKNVGSLSGGWRMKLALVKARLFKADIYLYDEPSNHLDKNHVQWLKDQMTGHEAAHETSMVISHDSGLLDAVCTNIIHFENFKLKNYVGNLSAFARHKPEAKTYFDLSGTEEKFLLPAPGFLEGVKTKDKSILKVSNVSYSYPGSSKKQLNNVTFQCSLNSRVAVLGPNGAGKSTLIKLLVGEMEPDSGNVARHPNLRIGYLSQNALSHLEAHGDRTPNQYIQERYKTGEDAEELNRSGRIISADEQAQMDQVHVIDGVKRKVDEVIRRRKLKNSYEYEVSFIGCSSADNQWIPRADLEKMGFAKKVQEVDAREAAQAGLLRPLTQREIESHLVQCGLDPEVATHSRISGLSGGQRIKTVLAGSTWCTYICSLFLNFC
jgi:elongation factor 3